MMPEQSVYHQENMESNQQFIFDIVRYNKRRKHENNRQNCFGRIQCWN